MQRCFNCGLTKESSLFGSDRKVLYYWSLAGRFVMDKDWHEGFSLCIGMAGGAFTIEHGQGNAL